MNLRPLTSAEVADYRDATIRTFAAEKVRPEWGGPCLWLDDIAIDFEHHGKGLGRLAVMRKDLASP